MADSSHTEDGGGYYASVSDLMAGLLFVFILVVVVFALQLATATQGAERQRAQMEEQRRALERELHGATSRLEDLERRRLDQEAELEAARRATQEEMRALRTQVGESLGNEVRRLDEVLNRARTRRAALLTSIQTSLEGRGVPVSIDLATGVLRLSDRILFASGRSELQPGSQAREVVRALADVLGQTVPCYSVGSDTKPNCGPEATPVIDGVFVEGHTDKRRLGTGERDGNYELSASRALSTYAFMQALRPELWELRNAQGVPLMGVSGYGPDRPVPGRLGDREEDLAANRRIEIRFLLATPAAPDLQFLQEQLQRLSAGETDVGR
jgi:flagellar motor protein MotB